MVKNRLHHTVQSATLLVLVIGACLNCSASVYADEKQEDSKNKSNKCNTKLSGLESHDFSLISNDFILPCTINHYTLIKERSSLPDECSKIYDSWYSEGVPLPEEAPLRALIIKHLSMHYVVEKVTHVVVTDIQVSFTCLSHDPAIKPRCGPGLKFKVSKYKCDSDS